MLEGCTPWPQELAQQYRARGYWQGWPLGDLIAQACERFSDRVAVVGGDRRMTYAELLREADHFAGLLSGHGVGPLDRVVVQLPNVPSFATIVLGLFRLGAIPVLAMSGHRQHEISYLCKYSDAKLLLIQDRFGGFDYRPMAQAVAQENPGLTPVVLGEAGPLTALENPAHAAAEVIFPRVDPSEPAFFLLSGGTTGLPKLIPRTHDDYVLNMLECVRALQVGPDSVYLVVNPLAHTSALGCPGLFGTLLVGGKVVLTSGPRPDEAFTLIESEGVTFTTLVPTTARMWMDHARRRPIDMSTVLLQIGSAKMAQGEAQRVRNVLGCPVSLWYGMGEGLLVYTRLDDPDDVALETEGRPISAADEIRVVDRVGTEVPTGQEGELQTRGPCIIRGYYRAEKLNAASFTPDGFFRTGDLVRQRADGNLVVVGRLKNIINRAGEKISIEEVEEYLLGHNEIRDVAVVGVEDESLGERTVAFVATDSQDLSAATLRVFLRSNGLAGFKAPDKFFMVDSLPKTPAGKHDKEALRKQAGSATARS